jgi:predicted RNase H-like nuclease (RuvC/YqgF family)
MVVTKFKCKYCYKYYKSEKNLQVHHTKCSKKIEKDQEEKERLEEEQKEKERIEKEREEEQKIIDSMTTPKEKYLLKKIDDLEWTIRDLKHKIEDNEYEIKWLYRNL